MADFTSGFWGWYVAILTLVSIIACAVFLRTQTTAKVKKGESVGTTGHSWDEDLAEWNNPLPGWWRNLFYITIVFSLVYLVLYPGLAVFPGVLGWSSKGQFETEVSRAEQQFGPIFDRYAKMDVPAVATDAQAREMGQRLFLTYCSQCHGSDARGARGFPNLANDAWQYGGEPEAIKTSIVAGRQGVMPPMVDAIGGPEAAKAVANYVRSLSNLPHDAKLAEQGKEKFTVCAACHGPDGKGNPQIGAPNLTDDEWIYSSSEAAIVEAITKGRQGVMPAWGEKLSPAKIHLLTAYVYGLSQGKK